MQLEIREGTHLYTASKEDLGIVRQFVVNPSTKELTHVLVEKGVFFADDRVVPIEAIDHADEDGVVLADDIDPAAIPHFVREDYTMVDEETRTHINAPPGFMWRYPTTYAGPFPIYPAHPMPPTGPTRRAVRDTRMQKMLAESELIGGRTPVISMNGEKIGTVSEMHTDDEGELSHLTVDLGFLSDEKVLPAHWIESIDSIGVHLAVSNTAVESLETIT
jgi:uncharacterized protein YrrD